MKMGYTTNVTVLPRVEKQRHIRHPYQVAFLQVVEKELIPTFLDQCSDWKAKVEFRTSF